MPDKIFISLDGAFNKTDSVNRDITLDAALFSHVIGEHSKVSPVFTKNDWPQVWTPELLNSVRKTLMKQANSHAVPAGSRKMLREWLRLLATANQEGRLMYWVHYQS
jgi:hypothetical protein